jgi:hypothetical protein
MAYTLDDNTKYVTPEREAEYQSSAYNYKLKAGLHNVGSYQVAGIPFVQTIASATPATAINFNSITRAITVTSMAGTLTGSFTANFTNKFYVPAGTTVRLEVKVESLYISGSSTASVVGELTGIDNSNITNNWSGSLLAKV